MSWVNPLTTAEIQHAEPYDADSYEQQHHFEDLSSEAAEAEYLEMVEARRDEQKRQADANFAYYSGQFEDVNF